MRLAIHAGLWFALLHPALDARTAMANVVISVSNSSVVTESCSPANHAVDPGETVTCNISLLNVGSDDAGDLSATLESFGGISFPSGTQHYGLMPVGAPPVSRSFSFLANGACGGSVTAKFHLHDGATDLGFVTYAIPLGAAIAGPVLTGYSTGNVAVPIPASGSIGDMADQHIVVSDTGLVADLDVHVRLNHTFDGDLTLTLVSPSGVAVTLCAKRGGPSANFGSGPNDCSGQTCVFDDESATPIGAGSAPFAGAFRPETPLSALDGSPAQGTWTLKIHDDTELDQGRLGCWRMVIQRAPRLCVSCAVTDVVREVAPAIELRPGVPNPFTSTTTIRYALPAAGPVTLAVYSIGGQRVATLVDGVQAAGEHAAQFSPGSGASLGRSTGVISPGVYFCVLRAGAYTSTRKLVLVR